MAFSFSREVNVVRIAGRSAFLRPKVEMGEPAFQIFCSNDASHYNSRTLSGADEIALQGLFVAQESGLIP